MTQSWKLLELRSRISRIDTQLVALLAERFSVAADIQRLKRTLQLPVEDVDREAQVLRQVDSLANDFGIDRVLVNDLWMLLFAAAKSGLMAVKEKQQRHPQNLPHMPKNGRREV